MTFPKTITIEEIPLSDEFENDDGDDEDEDSVPAKPYQHGYYRRDEQEINSWVDIRKGWKPVDLSDQDQDDYDDYLNSLY